MKRIICLCNTYFQLIVSIQLKLTVFSEDSVSVVISDRSNASFNIYSIIKKNNMFENCFFIETKNIKAKEKFGKYINIMKGNDLIWKEVNNNNFDEIIYFNKYIELYTLYAYISKINPSVKVSRYEEGIFSYHTPMKTNKKIKFVQLIRKLSKKPILDENYHNFYCFYPELYKGDLNPIEIPQINHGDEMKHILREIFGLGDDLEKMYDYKYIYFSSVYDFEGGESIGELELVQKIADLVGNENLLVKVHPRDDRTRFLEKGLQVDTNSDVPWEAIVLGHDFSNHIFLTATSGSAISSCLLAEKVPKVYYLYQLCDTKENAVARNSVSVIENLLNSDFAKKRNFDIVVPDRLEDILQTEERKKIIE